MTVPTRITRELVIIHDYQLRDFLSIQEINITLMHMAEMFHDDVEIYPDSDWDLGLFLPFANLGQYHVNIGPHSQSAKLYRILADHLHGVYSLGAVYTMQAMGFKRAGNLLLLSIDTRWKIGSWRL